MLGLESTGVLAPVSRSSISGDDDALQIQPNVKVTYADGVSELVAADSVPEGFIVGSTDEMGQNTYFHVDHADIINVVTADGSSIVFHKECQPEAVHSLEIDGVTAYFTSETVPDGVHSIEINGATTYFTAETVPDGVYSAQIDNVTVYFTADSAPEGYYPVYARPGEPLRFIRSEREVISPRRYGQPFFYRATDEDGASYYVQTINGFSDDSYTLWNPYASGGAWGHSVDSRFAGQVDGAVKLYRWQNGRTDDYILGGYPRPGSYTYCMDQDGDNYYIWNQNRSALLRGQGMVSARAANGCSVYVHPTRLESEGYIALETATGHVYFHQDCTSLPSGVYQISGEDGELIYVHDSFLPDDHHVVVDAEGNNIEFVDTDGEALPEGVFSVEDADGNRIYFHESNVAPEVDSVINSDGDTVYYAIDNPEGAGVQSVTVNGQSFMHHESVSIEGKYLVVNIDGQVVLSDEEPAGLTRCMDSDGRVFYTNNEDVLGQYVETTDGLFINPDAKPEGYYSVNGVYFHQDSPPEGYIGLYRGGDHPVRFLPDNIDDVPFSQRYGTNHHILHRGIDADGNEFYYDTGYWNQLRRRGYVNVYTHGYRQPTLIHQSQIENQPDLIEVRPIRSLNYRYIRRDDAAAMRQAGWIKVIDGDGDEFCVPSRVCGNVGIYQYYIGNYVRTVDETGMPVIVDKTALPDGYISVETATGHVYFHQDSPRLPSGVYQIPGEDGELIYVHDSNLPDGHHIVVDSEGNNIEFVDTDGDDLPAGVLFVEDAAGNRIYFHESNVAPEVSTVFDSEGNPVYFMDDNPVPGVLSVDTKDGAPIFFHQSNQPEGVFMVEIDGEIVYFHHTSPPDGYLPLYTSHGTASEFVGPDYEPEYPICKCIDADGTVRYVDYARLRQESYVGDASDDFYSDYFKVHLGDSEYGQPVIMHRDFVATKDDLHPIYYYRGDSGQPEIIGYVEGDDIRPFGGTRAQSNFDYYKVYNFDGTHHYAYIPQDSPDDVYPTIPSYISRGYDENGYLVYVNNTNLPEEAMRVETATDVFYIHADCNQLPDGVYRSTDDACNIVFRHESLPAENEHMVIDVDGNKCWFVDTDGSDLPEGVQSFDTPLGRQYYHQSNLPEGKLLVVDVDGNLSFVEEAPDGYLQCVSQDGQVYYTNSPDIQSQYVKVFEDGQYVYKADSQVSDALIPVQEADGDTYLSDQASLSESYVLGTDEAGEPVYINKSELPSGYHMVQDRDGNEICFHEDNLPEDVHVIYYDGEVVYYHQDEIDTRVEAAEATAKRESEKAKTAIQKLRDRVSEMGGNVLDALDSLLIRPIEGLVVPIADVVDDVVDAAPMVRAAGDVAITGADIVMGDVLEHSDVIFPLVGTLLSLGAYGIYVGKKMHRLKKEVRAQRAKVELGQTLAVNSKNPVERLFATEMLKKEAQAIRDELLNVVEAQAVRYATLMIQFASGESIPEDIDEIRSDFESLTKALETFRCSALVTQLRALKVAAETALDSRADEADVSALTALTVQLPVLVESTKEKSLTWMDLVSDRKGTAGMAVTADAFVDKAKEDQEDSFFTSAADYMVVLDQLRFTPQGGIVKSHLIEKEGVLSPKVIIQMLGKAGLLHAEKRDKFGRRRFRIHRDLTTYTLKGFQLLVDANKDKYAKLIKKLGKEKLAQALYDGVRRMQVRVVKHGVVMTNLEKHRDDFIAQLEEKWGRLPRDIQMAYRGNPEGLCDAIIQCVKNNTAPSFAMIDKLYGSVVSGPIARVLLSGPTKALCERTLSAQINKELRDSGVIKPGTTEELMKWVSDHCPDAVKKHPKAAKIAASIIMAAGVTVATGGTAAVAVILAKLGVGLAGLAAAAGGAAGSVTGIRVAVQEVTKRGLESSLGEMDEAITAALEALKDVEINVADGAIQLAKVAGGDEAAAREDVLEAVPVSDMVLRMRGMDVGSLPVAGLV